MPSPIAIIAASRRRGKDFSPLAEAITEAAFNENLDAIKRIIGIKPPRIYVGLWPDFYGKWQA